MREPTEVKKKKKGNWAPLEKEIRNSGGLSGKILADFLKVTKWRRMSLFGLCSGPMNLLGSSFSVIGRNSVTATWLIRTLPSPVYPSIPHHPPPPNPTHITEGGLGENKLEHEVWPLNQAQDKTHYTVGKNKRLS